MSLAGAGRRVVAAGDIACAPGSRDPCRHVETLGVVESLGPDLVLPLGDNQYESGTLDEYDLVYNLSWGRMRARSRPVAGNHQYVSDGARGYFDYCVLALRLGPGAYQWKFVAAGGMPLADGGTGMCH